MPAPPALRVVPGGHTAAGAAVDAYELDSGCGLVVTVCAHGATVGELDANALFYLASRGIAPAEAKALLLRGFIAGVFDDVADAAARERLEAAASAALERML